MNVKYVNFQEFYFGHARLLLDVPYRDGYREWRTGISFSNSVYEPSPSLVNRVKHIVLGTLLWIPLVNIVADIALRITTKIKPSENDSPATLDKTVVTTTDQEMQEPTVYTKFADSWAMLDGMRIYFSEAMHLPAWKSEKARAFILSELLAIHIAFEELKKEAPALIKELEGKKDSSHLIPLYELQNAVTNSMEELLPLIQDQLQELPEPAPQTETVGLTNVGNTCYINSAMQPLLALGNFPDLIAGDIQQRPDETVVNFGRRSVIMASLRAFVEGWARRESPAQLGRRLGELRADIFLASLQEGGFVNPEQEMDFQDAGSFFELVLHVIGLGFQVMEKKTPYNQSGRVIDRPRQRIVPMAIYSTETPGTVQERVNVYGRPRRQFDTGWIPDGQTVAAAEQDEEYKILGQPPEFLIIGVNNVKEDENGDIRDLGHEVTSNDIHVDFSPIFELPVPAGQARYELVGFSQNHNQVHWTSVIRVGDAWRYCNDSIVNPVDPRSAEFKHPANYMVYKKIH